ncbi:MAG: hypothetical protein LBV40_01375 [Methanomicrobiales archaeon]|jgi:hypothetical protein|nr:hypothetical protein [Methanomicrobiales archaeon]
MDISSKERTCNIENKRGKDDSKQNTHIRNVTHIAASRLEDRGYIVIKSMTRSWPYDMIACNQHHILFIATRRHTKVHTPKQILKIYTDLISDMWQAPAPSIAEKQLWIYHNDHGFVIYKLFQKGIMKKEDI